MSKKNNHIYKGKRQLHISKDDGYNSNSMYILWKKERDSKRIIGNIIITNSLIRIVMEKFKSKLLTDGSKTPDFDDILISTVVDTLNHENMHLAIYDTDGLHSSRLYDFFLGGTLTNNEGIISSGGPTMQYRRKIKYRDYLP